MQNSISYLYISPLWRKIILFLFSLILMHVSTTASYANTQNNASPKPMWYRYYDKNGIANISSTVTPAHVRHGYEALDRNMQVIKRSQPYSTEKDLQQSAHRATQYQRNEHDVRLKKAYGASKTAINKKNEALINIQKQIKAQTDQLTQLQKDRVLFQKEEAIYVRKGKAVPQPLKETLTNNANNIQFFKKNIAALQIHYRNTQSNYDAIINRLKVIE